MILGKGVAGKMRFRQKTQSSDAACSWKLVPVCFPHGMERERLGQLGEQPAELPWIRQGGPVATVRFNHPLAAAHGLLLGASALRAELGGARNRLTAVDAELGGGFGARWRSRRRRDR